MAGEKEERALTQEIYTGNAVQHDGRGLNADSYDTYLSGMVPS